MRNISWQQTAVTILVIRDGTVTKKNKKGTHFLRSIKSVVFDF
jgi:hypothetical protein